MKDHPTRGRRRRYFHRPRRARGGRILTAKVPSTPGDQSEGVMNAIEASEVEAGAVVALAHGMTVATNALLERRGARTALVTTAGFRDVLEIARQNRPSLYDLAQDRPPALVPRGLRFTVEERMGPTESWRRSMTRAWKPPSPPCKRRR